MGRALDCSTIAMADQVLAVLRDAPAPIPANEVAELAGCCGLGLNPLDVAELRPVLGYLEHEGAIDRRPLPGRLVGWALRPDGDE